MPRRVRRARRAAPVAVTFAGGSDSLPVDAIVEGLSFAPEGSTLQPQLNVTIVRAGLAGSPAVEAPGTDATWDVTSGTPVVVPSNSGPGGDDDQLTSELLRSAAPSRGSDRTRS